MSADTGKQNVLLSDESNKIMFLNTGKQNILLPGTSNNIKCLWTPGSKMFCFLTRAIR